MNYVIMDWANNPMFPGTEFESYEDAHEYLCDFLEGNNMDIEEWLDEYWIREVSELKRGRA